MRDERPASWDLRPALIRAGDSGPSSPTLPCRVPGCPHVGTYGKVFCKVHILRWPYAAALRARVDHRAAELAARQLRPGIVTADVAVVLRFDLGGTSTVANLVKRTGLPMWAVFEALRVIGAREVDPNGRPRRPGRRAFALDL